MVQYADNYVIKCIGWADTAIGCPFTGQYLETFTPTEIVKGTWNSDINKAMVFPDFIDAWNLWKTSIGIRIHDGKPNRPLTAFTIEVIRKEIK